MPHLDLFDLQVEIHCHDEAARDLVIANFSAFVTTPSGTAPPDLTYTVSRDGRGFCLQRIESIAPSSWEGIDAAELLFLLEKELTIEAQKRRPELYFMHAAALSFRDRAFLLIGRSGNGKSTTCWGLLHHGCGYLSDELAPIDLQTRMIQPYPHALCLKSEPAPPYSLPEHVLRTDPTLHVAVEHLPCPALREPVPLRAIFHVQHIDVDQPPILTDLGTAEAGMLIYANALNPLCHNEDGLDAALDIARHSRTFRLTTGRLDASVDMILEALSH